MNVVCRWPACGLVLASALAQAGPALSDDTSDSEECNIYFRVDNQTAKEVDSRVLKRQNATNVDMPDVAANTSDTIACYWLENDNRRSSVEVSYGSGAQGYFVVNYVARYENGELDQNAVVTRDQGSNIVASYDRSKTTLTITDAD